MRMRLGLLSTLARGYAFLFKQANAFNVALYAQSNPTRVLKTKHGSIALTCENPITLWRAKTFFTKEPDTLEWIDDMQPGDVFFDVGANVGLYSLYAAKRGLRVFAFEPESQNYAILNRNIYLNGMQESIAAFNLALSDRNLVDFIYLSQMEKGAALHNVGSPRDFSGNAFIPEFRQGIMAVTLDELVQTFKLPRPDHVKIDVDGCEAAIVSGAQETFANENFSSLLIELNMSLPVDQKTKEKLESSGFSHDVKQIKGTQGDRFEGVSNFIFHRRLLVKPLMSDVNA
jgi:FkbM family methyltransferase